MRTMVLAPTFDIAKEFAQLRGLTKCNFVYRPEHIRGVDRNSTLFIVEPEKIIDIDYWLMECKLRMITVQRFRIATEQRTLEEVIGEH